MYCKKCHNQTLLHFITHEVYLNPPVEYHFCTRCGSVTGVTKYSNTEHRDYDHYPLSQYGRMPYKAQSAARKLLDRYLPHIQAPSPSKPEWEKSAELDQSYNEQMTVDLEMERLGADNFYAEYGYVPFDEYDCASHDSRPRGESLTESTSQSNPSDTVYVSVTLSEDNWKAILQILKQYCRLQGEDWIQWGDSLERVIQTAIEKSNCE